MVGIENMEFHEYTVGIWPKLYTQSCLTIANFISFTWLKSQQL
jgi:hypothetical protein